MNISKGFVILLIAMLAGCSTLGIKKEVNFRQDVFGVGDGRVYQFRIYNK